MNVISGRIAVPESADNDITASQLVSSGHSVDGSGQGEQIARQGLHHGNCTLDSDRPPKETTKSVVDQPLQAHAPPVERTHAPQDVLRARHSARQRIQATAVRSCNGRLANSRLADASSDAIGSTASCQLSSHVRQALTHIQVVCPCVHATKRYQRRCGCHFPTTLQRQPKPRVQRNDSFSVGTERVASVHQCTGLVMRYNSFAIFWSTNVWLHLPSCTDLKNRYLLEYEPFDSVPWWSNAPKQLF